MVKYENYGLSDIGVPLTRAYSDAGYMIARDGIEYIEAIDPTDKGRTYVETDTEIKTGPQTVDDLLEEVKGDD